MALGYGAVGCSSGNSGGKSGNSGGSSSATTSTPSTCANNLELAFAPDMYSAYIDNSDHTFQLPVVANGVSGATVKWTASDPSMVQIDPGDTSGGAMLTMQKAGEVTITATANGLCGTSTLHITAATEDQWQAGNARYNNMNPLPGFGTDGGVPTNFRRILIDPPGMPPACTNCHGDQATNSVFKTISHTPEQTGGFSDQDLIQIFTAGAVPQDGYFDTSLVPSFVWSFFHKWSDITGDAQQGMVVYLRSLAPKAQGGTSDFNMFRRARIMPATTGSGGASGAGGASSSTGGSPSSAGGTSGSSGGTSSGGGSTGTGGASQGGTSGGGGTASASSGGSAGESGAAGAGGK